MRTEEAGERAICPLYPFDCDSDAVELAGGIRIERAPDSFKELLSQRCLGLDSFWDESAKVEEVWIASLPYLDKTLNTIMAEKRDASELLADIFSVRTEISVFCFVTALRLYKEGLVTPGPIAIPVSKGKEPMWLTPSWLDIRSDDYAFVEPRTFSLQTADVPAINDLLQDVYSWRIKSKPESMRVALSRFHSSYRGEPEERIIDQMIAFEAICLEGEQELQYRLALRVACLLGGDAKTRNSIFKDMRNAYRLRSAIVHGSHSIAQKELENILPRSEEYLRRSIRKFLSLLSQGYGFKQIREQLLDQNIMDSDMHL